MPVNPKRTRQIEPTGQRLLTIAFWLLLLFVLFSSSGNTSSVLPIATLCMYIMLPWVWLVKGIQPAVRRPFVLTLLLLFIISLWSAIQVLPMQGILNSNPAWTYIAPLGREAISSISVAPGDMQFGLLAVGIPFGAFLLSLAIFDTDERAVSALKFIAAMGGIIALFSILQFQLFPETLMLGKKKYHLSSLTAPFVNRNTAGTFFGLISLVSVAIAARSISKINFSRLLLPITPQRFKLDAKEIFDATFFSSLSILLMTALFLTESRGAAGSTFAAFVVLILLTSLAKPTHVEPNTSCTKSGLQLYGRLFGGFALITVIVAAYSFLAGRVALRVEIGELKDARFCVMPGIMLAIRDAWPLGTGLSSFREVFPAYRDSNCGIQYVWQRAHNGYAEGVLSLGIVFLAIWIVMFGALGTVYLKGLKTRKRLRIVGALGFATMTLLSLHAAVDYSLQIAGMAVFCAAIVGPIVTICLKRDGAPNLYTSSRSETTASASSTVQPSSPKQERSVDFR